jgi:hypothetical protein
MLVTKLAAVMVMVLVGQAQEPVYYTNARVGRIPHKIDRERVGQIAQMRLMKSSNKGLSYEQEDVITPEKEHFSYAVPADGEYWFQIVVRGKDGREDPSDQEILKLPPAMKIVVDTKPPDVKIKSAVREGENLVVSWWLYDENPNPDQLKIEYRALDSTVWTPMTVTPSPSGTATAKVPGKAPLIVRMSFKDLANNSRETEAQVAAGTGATPPLTQPTVVQTTSSPYPQIPPTMPQIAPATPPQMPLPEKLAVPQPPAYGAAPSNDVNLAHASPAGVGPAAAATAPSIPIASTIESSRPAYNPVPSNAMPRPLPEITLVSDKRIMVEYELSKIGPSGLSSVEVWLTRDKGMNWTKFVEDKNASQATSGGKYERELILPGDGLYGITLVVKSKAGLGKAWPRAGDTPELMVEVDSTPPTGQLNSPIPDPQHPGTVVLTWIAKDKNIADAPTTLEWSENPAGPWTKIASDLPNTGAEYPNTGRFDWIVPPGMPSHVFLKITVRDKAGNEAAARSREAHLIDVSEPEGRLIRIVPAGKR